METENFSSQNSSSYKLDSIDKQLLKLLKSNSKLNSKELAAEVGLTLTPTYERVKRLENKGFIKSYTIKLDREKIGKNLRVLCNVSLKSHALEFLNAFEEKVVQLKEISSCFHIAGNFDYLLLIEVKDMNEYSVFLKEKLATIPHIAQVQSSFVMKTMKEE
jgi:Lrp/AsnC family transcriptional regulator, leucine-responsive regulatory protein